MKKVEAPTLEEAYIKAAAELSCSINNLQYEVIQHPSKGLLGLMKKQAIIVATCNNSSATTPPLEEEEQITINKSIPIVAESYSHKEKKPKIVEEKKVKKEKLEKEDILENFFESKSDSNKDIENINGTIVYNELALLIETQLKELLALSCFKIDVVEVDVRDNIALIFIDGEDAALLIGKEGYRYNALSYMIFNWLHSKYELFIKVEIAEFLTTQQEMIKSYMKPVIEKVNKNGRGKTRFLDGILVQIALEQLREEFPNKYVAIKRGKDGKRFVVINKFNSSKPDA